MYKWFSFILFVDPFSCGKGIERIVCVYVCVRFLFCVVCSIIQKSEVILYMHILIHLSLANSFKMTMTFFFSHHRKRKQDTRCKLRKPCTMAYVSYYAFYYLNHLSRSISLSVWKKKTQEMYWICLISSRCLCGCALVRCLHIYITMNTPVIGTYFEKILVVNYVFNSQLQWAVNQIS